MPDNEKAVKSVVDKITIWIGVISSVITISLTIVNTIIQNRIQDKDRELKNWEMRLKEDQKNLEASKEKVSRYSWIQKLIPDLIDDNALYFLSHTDATAWSPQQITEAQSVISRLETRHSQGMAPMGAQTMDAFREFKSFVGGLRSQQ